MNEGTILYILTTGLDQLRRDIISSSEAASQRASGRTYDAITAVVDNSSVGVTNGGIEAPTYFYTLIRGRGAGKVPANMVQIIDDWAKYKGITFSSPQDALRFARAVAWKIRREGSWLYRNHMYVDIIDTPVANFEAWLNDEMDRLFNREIADIFNETTTRSFGADNFAGHGYII